MNNIKLDKQQSKTIAQAVYGDIKNYCDVNFERFLMFYLDERKKANGRPIEPITIRFNPCFPCDCRDITDNTTDIVEKKESI